MDDRTFIGKSTQDVQKAKEIWEEVAELRENPDEAQAVDASKRFGSFEVLGSPCASDFNESRVKKRICKASSTYKKISLLPENALKKLRDGGIFCRRVMAYGWISFKPRAKDDRSLEVASMWASIGRTRFASPALRKVVAGANTSLSMTAGPGQLD